MERVYKAEWERLSRIRAEVPRCTDRKCCDALIRQIGDIYGSWSALIESGKLGLKEMRKLLAEVAGLIEYVEIRRNRCMP